MLKLVSTDASFFHDEPNISIIQSGSTEGLVKAAADSAVTEFVSRLAPDENKIYLHILAMGAGEFFGSNRNGDYFPEGNLLDHYKTFETSPAHVFKNHVNKDPTIAIGQVVFAIYNQRMHRVELVAWVDRIKGKDVVERIERGEYPSTSMACRTPYDVCAVCGNKARTRQEYCEHLGFELGRLYPDGRRAMALNVAPLRFFDISIVIRPADVTSSVLQKVAFAGGEYLQGSAELAEAEGLVEKAAAHKKLSEFIKNLEGEVADYDDELEPLLSRVKDPHPGSIQALSEYGLGEVLDTFAHLGISPSLSYLADMIGHRIAGEAGLGVGPLVEGYMKQHGVANLPLSDNEFSEGGPNRKIVDILLPSVKEASMYPYFIMQRSFDSPVPNGNTVFVPGTGHGYSGNGPHIEPTPREVYRALEERANAGNQDDSLLHMLKTLLTVGGVALAAKWYITRMIEKRMQGIQNSQQNPNSDVKIVMVKSSADAQLSAKLAKMSLLRSTKKD